MCGADSRGSIHYRFGALEYRRSGLENASPVSLTNRFLRTRYTPKGGTNDHRTGQRHRGFACDCGVAEGHRCPRARWISWIPSRCRCSSDFGALSRLAPDRATPERGVGGCGAARLRAPLSSERLTAGCSPLGLGGVDVSESSSAPTGGTNSGSVCIAVSDIIHLNFAA